VGRTSRRLRILQSVEKRKEGVGRHRAAVASPRGNSGRHRAAVASPRGYSGRHRPAVASPRGYSGCFHTF
jgi:hypothetical protein